MTTSDAAIRTEIAGLRAQQKLAEQESVGWLTRSIALKKAADELETCLRERRCLRQDLKMAREFLGPTVGAPFETDPNGSSPFGAGLVS